MDNSEKGKRTSGSHISYWTDTTGAIQYRSLDKDLEAEVVIVGGGISGLTVAYCLLKSGKKVVVIEDGYVGSGETGRTTAHIANALDDRYYEIERIFGAKKAALAAKSHTEAINFIEQTCLKENIACDFEKVSGYLFLHPSDNRESLHKEYLSAKKAGVSVEEMDYLPGTTEKIPCLKFSGQAQFHPMKYLKGLAEAIIRDGGEIYTSTHASEINSKGIKTDKGFSVKAKHVVVATNSPVNNKYAMHLKQYPYRTYAIAAKIKKGVVPKALWWDTGNFEENSEIAPYHYVRTQKFSDDHDLLICGGEDHPTGIAPDNKVNEEDRYALLEYWAKKIFPIEEIVYNWSGQVLEPMDCLGYIGRNPADKDNVYIVTGDSGNGITHGTIAGKLISDLINGNKNEYEKLYDPSRFKIFAAGKTFFKELGSGMLAYMKNKSEDSKPVEIAQVVAGEGKIIEVEGDKYAAYRDDDGQLHIVAAECTHLGCIIKWNKDEKSWDCPCHGSRFTHEGTVLNGPAIKNLSYYTPGKVLNDKKELENQDEE